MDMKYMTFLMSGYLSPKLLIGTAKFSPDVKNNQIYICTYRSFQWC